VFDLDRVEQLLALPSRAVAVVLVDLQNDFCHPEAFGQNPSSRPKPRIEDSGLSTRVRSLIRTD
jgi:hypothetical protein